MAFILGKICLFFALILFASSETEGPFQKVAQELMKDKKLNHRPIIGVVSQKVTTKFLPKLKKTATYIAASYIKYLEGAGAEVIPILSTYPKKRVLHITRRVNGVLFPGGAAPIDDSNYARVTKIIFKEAKRLNNKKIHFPIWGTCLGFEALTVLASGKKGEDILSAVNAENMAVPVNMTLEAFRSRIFEKFEIDTIRALMFTNISLHTHQMGVTPDKFSINEKLDGFYKVLGVNTDFDGKQFVSMIEGRDYPFYGTQFHPEKNIYEWTTKLEINHSPEAIKVGQQFANFFVNEARKNSQEFETLEDAVKELIFHYAPVYSGGRSLFQQVYVFGKDSPDKIDLIRNGEII